ncbi:MAG: hypothetical protein IPM82_17065 [Saprospiraceae bacterium]|nr:hypothetical protein [Saprospiraceae bacterium]
MTEEPVAKIDRIIGEGINFKFSDYISRGFEIFQKDMGSFIGFTVIYFVLSMVISFIPIVGNIANQLVVSPALIVGLYLFANKLDKGERPEFGTFFKGFDFVGQLVLAALVMGIILGISMIPFGFAIWNSGLVEWYMDVVQNPGTPPPPIPIADIPWWSLLLLLPTIFLAVAYAWTNLFIVFYRMEFWPAMEASRRLITKNWVIFFAFSFVTGLIMMLGIILLCVGILATFPAAMCMAYAAFADVTKLNEETSEGDGIERHLIS